MRGIYKKLTFEDKFARKFYRNSYRFLPDMKKQNRKKLRRILKEIRYDRTMQHLPRLQSDGEPKLPRLT